MQETLDDHLTRDHNSPEQYQFAGFWPRLGAALVDGLVLIPIAVVILFNMFLWKSSPIFALCVLVNLCYKPFMEFKYGATVGKMAARIKVVNAQMEAPGIQEALFRNVFHILFVIISFVSTLWLFSLPDFTDVQSLRSYSLFIREHDDYSGITTYLPALITVADAIVMLADVFRRSIHDRIGKTYVIKY